MDLHIERKMKMFQQVIHGFKLSNTASKNNMDPWNDKAISIKKNQIKYVLFKIQLAVFVFYLKHGSLF